MVKALLSDLRIFLILSFISLTLTALDNFNFLNFPKSLVQIVTTPIQYGLFKTSIVFSKQFEFVVLSRRAAQENKALSEQLAQVLSENANLRRKLSETEGFLAQQNSLSPQTFNLVAARPIGKSRYLSLDKGESDGLSLGQAVIYKDNYIGTIKEISAKTSQVILASDPDSKVAAFVASKDGRARGILAGEFGSEMILDKILHSEPISKGDLVYSEGTEGNLPRGLVLGLVNEVLDRQNQIFKQAKIRSVFEVGNLDIVFVVNQ